MPKAMSLSIGQIADRTGLSVSAIRFYEAKGLVKPTRNKSGQRSFQRSDIRRLSFVLIAQQLGFPLEEIGERVWTPPHLQAFSSITSKYDCQRVFGLLSDAVFIGTGP